MTNEWRLTKQWKFNCNIEMYDICITIGEIYCTNTGNTSSNMVYSSLVMLLLLVLICYHNSDAFTTIFTSSKAHLEHCSIKSQRCRSLPPLFEKRENNIVLPSSRGLTSSLSTKRKRKRKRKKTEQVVDTTNANNSTTKDEGGDLIGGKMKEARPEESEEDSTASSPVLLKLEPRDDVLMEVKSIIGGTDDISSAENKMMVRSSFVDEDEISNNNLDDDILSSRSSLDDSLDQLLEDARRMKAEEGEELNSGGGSGLLFDEEGRGIKSAIGNALSTIVTADFFVVCGFLVWFLLGIFCSSILKDDTVQIAFNNNFEKLVQPALGILMIASVGGSFFNKEEEVQ